MRIRQVNKFERIILVQPLPRIEVTYLGTQIKSQKLKTYPH